MKIIKQITFVIFNLILLSSNCKKDNQAPQSELSRLPPVTQTGAHTFGCLINGVAFLPSKQEFLGPSKLNISVFSNNLTITVLNDGPGQGFRLMDIGIDSTNVVAAQAYQFKTLYTSGAAFASYSIYTATGGGNLYYITENQYATTNVVSGQLNITKYDGHICSGTFFFNAINTTGDTVKVTDGRFDMPVQ